MTKRTDLLASIASTTADYREGDLAAPTPDHVDRWVRQFDEDVQIPILREMDHVLKQTYITRKETRKFLSGLFQTKKLVGDNPCAFWRGVNFLDIQGGGASQKEMLALFSKLLEKKCGFSVDNCGADPKVFVYLDDAIFSGGRVSHDLTTWIADEAPDEAQLHVIVMATHQGSYYYRNRVSKAQKNSDKKIKITWWNAIELEDRKKYTDSSDVLRPVSIPADNTVQTYVDALRYRDSRLPWLGDVPEHWNVLRSKYVFREVDNRSENGEETQLSMSQIHGLVESSKIDTWRLRSENYTGGKLCEAGDLVLNRLKAHLGVFAHASIPGVVSPDYTVFRLVRDAEVRYFEQLYKTPSYKAELRRRTKGIVEGFWRLYTDDFYDIRTVVPPPSEQIQIVVFIDSFDSRVNRLIRNKRRLIALLNEQKQGIINRAVTRGLDPAAPMKPTGIDWMPEVPAHWVVKPLKHWLREPAKKLGEDTPPDYEFDYIDIGCVGTGFLTAKPERMQFKGAPSRARQIVRRGDTIISTVRTYLKAVYFIGDDWPDLIASTGFAVLRPVQAVNPRLLGYILQTSSFIERVTKNSIGVSYPAISETRLGTLHIVVPPDQDEQQEILAYIQRETSNLDKAMNEAQKEIALIREYRQRLIADVVTGKLDVRGVDLPEVDGDAAATLDTPLGATPEPAEVDA